VNHASFLLQSWYDRRRKRRRLRGNTSDWEKPLGGEIQYLKSAEKAMKRNNLTNKSEYGTL
jgi:hypothetical protein